MAKKGERKKVHTGRLVHEQEHAEGVHDLTPWVEMKSSRLARPRYDRINQSIQIDWGNGNTGYVYKECGYEMWRSFIRASSKGRFVNSHLNSKDYGADAESIALPSNEDLTNPTARGKRISEERRVAGEKRVGLE